MTADLPEFAWRKSSYSGDQSNCVEVARAANEVGIRDSKAATTGALLLPRRSFVGFLRALRG